jgi:phytol kinase
VRVTRSLEGSAAVMLCGMAAAFLGLWVCGITPQRALAVGAACGAVGAAVEAVSHHGIDNLTIQIAASGAAWYLLS